MGALQTLPLWEGAIVTHLPTGEIFRVVTVGFVPHLHLRLIPFNLHISPVVTETIEIGVKDFFENYQSVNERAVI